MSSSLLALLNPGDWSGIAERNTGGLMRDRATFAEAIWTRTGESAFIKCIWPARPFAGPDTRELGHPARLARIYDRLNLAAAHKVIPLVPIFHLELHSATGALILGMKRLRKIGDMIDAGLAEVSLAANFLQRIGPIEVSGYEWCHFDICPQNTGVDENGDTWLMDPESLYIEAAAAGIEVSYPACKDARVPNRLLVEARVPRPRYDALRQKHAFEVLLVAAECCLGFIDPAAGIAAGCATDYAPDTWLHPWLDKCELQHPELVKFWRPWLTRALDMGMHSTLEVAADLIAFAQRLAATPHRERPMTDATADFDLTHYHRQMRRDRLQRADLLHYADLLQRSNASQPSIANHLELIVLASCYLRDPVLGLEYARQASQVFQNDGRIKDWLDRLEVWTHGKAQ
jgi:hypothetical protein